MSKYSFGAALYGGYWRHCNDIESLSYCYCSRAHSVVPTPLFCSCWPRNLCDEGLDPYWNIPDRVQMTYCSVCHKHTCVQLHLLSTRGTNTPSVKDCQRLLTQCWTNPPNRIIYYSSDPHNCLNRDPLGGIFPPACVQPTKYSMHVSLWRDIYLIQMSTLLINRTVVPVEILLFSSHFEKCKQDTVVIHGKQQAALAEVLWLTSECSIYAPAD